MPDQSMTHTDGATTGAVKAGDADTKVKVMSSRTSADRPWLDHYPVADGWDMTLVPKPLYTLVDETAARIPNRIAIDFLGKTLTYGELLSAINEVAAGLQARGLKKGDRIGLLLPNTPYYVIMHYAILKAGGIVVNINPLYAEREIANLVRDSGLEMLATVDLAALYNKIVPLFAHSPMFCRSRKICCSGWSRARNWPAFRTITGISGSSLCVRLAVSLPRLSSTRSRISRFCNIPVGQPVFPRVPC
jgi:hypothetical protein